MAREIIPYKPALKEIARGLRNDSTLGEILLWKQLRNKQLLGSHSSRTRGPRHEVIFQGSPSDIQNWKGKTSSAPGSTSRKALKRKST